MTTKYLIKIPRTTTIIYNEKKNFIVLIGPFQTRSLTLKLKINVLKDLNAIEITNNPYFSVPNNEKKKIKSVQGTTVAMLKQLLFETSYMIYKKLKFVGVGYRAFPIHGYRNSVMMFKLGYSHPVYFKIPEPLKFFCLKHTNLFVYGNSYQTVSQVSSTIRLCKKPEPYKGKGILYSKEVVSLKEGKKV